MKDQVEPGSVTSSGRSQGTRTFSLFGLISGTRASCTARRWKPWAKTLAVVRCQERIETPTLEAITQVQSELQSTTGAYI